MYHSYLHAASWGNPFILDGSLAVWDMVTMSESQTVTDISGNGHHAQLGSSSESDSAEPVSIVTGMKWPDQTVRYLTVPGILDPASGDFSVVILAKFDRPNTGQVAISQQDGTGTGRSWLNVTSTNELSTSIGGVGTTATGTALEPGVWYLLGVTVTGTTIRLWLDDTQIKSATITPGTATGTIIIGADRFLGNTWSGVLGCVALYSRGLVQADFTEIQTGIPALLDARGSVFDSSMPAYIASKNPTNPVVSANQFPFMAGGIRSPSIVEYDADTWAMLYTCRDSGGTWTGVSYATSPKSDPHNWTAQDHLILSGTHRGVCAMRDDDGTWIVGYHTGDTGIFIATGPDIEILTPVPTAILAGQGTDWEQFVVHPDLHKIDGVYHLYYTGKQGTFTGVVGALGHATSPDLVTWTRDAANPVILWGRSGWDGSEVAHASYARINGRRLLFYSGYDGSPDPWPHHIGYLISGGSLSDFSRYQGNPVISPGASGAWDDVSAEDPVVFQENGNTHIYYMGRDTATSPYSQIGYATLS